MKKYKYPGIRVTTNGNQLVAKTEAKISTCGVFYPITPSTEQGENFEMAVALGGLTVFGEKIKAIEAEGEHAAQGGAIAISVTGKRVSNFTSGQGLVYGLEQYYHAPGKLSTMVLNVGARALTKHALNVHCGHDDIMAALDTGWTMFMAKDAQQAVDQSIILRKVNELSLNPGMNIQDGFLTTHLERTFFEPEPDLIREYLGRAEDLIDTPTEDQKELFGEKRRRVPDMYNLQHPILLGSVQNQEHYMTGVVARRKSFTDHILTFAEKCMKEYEVLTGRYYGFLSEYKTNNADTLFFALGSAAENIEAAVDYIEEQYGDHVGVLHLNVIRPFPLDAIIKAIKGKKNLVIFERTDESCSLANPIAKEIRAAISMAQQSGQLSLEETPRIFETVYGLGSRDFRPEHILGAWEYVRGRNQRQDGKKESEGEYFFYLGVNHPYAVISKEKPSLLPKNSIAVRIHSIGGWGAITTGKNMAEILGNLSHVSKYYTKENPEVVHISANPKYGSEKKGAPTNYFLVAANERIRVNCNLKHVDVVLCCDPKIFTHTNPLEGIKQGGAFIWESELEEQETWNRIPPHFRKEIIEKEIKLFQLDGFHIARLHTPHESLQTRMQGNSFLGAFFKVSTFLNNHGINHDVFMTEVLNQYRKKFGKQGEDVVQSNVDVMLSGFKGVKVINYGKINDTDKSKMTGDVICPSAGCSDCHSKGCSTSPIFDYENYLKEFSGNMDNQRASALTSTGIIPAKTGARNSKFVSRIKTPIYDPYNCTQCMACINVCPDTALFNTIQNVDTYIETVFKNYITNSKDSLLLLAKSQEINEAVRTKMNLELENKNSPPLSFSQIVFEEIQRYPIQNKTIDEVRGIMSVLPLGYGKTRQSYQAMEKKYQGSGGLFSIYVTDLCKGCGECVDACGDKQALKMEVETDELRAVHLTGTEYFKLLPSTPDQYLGHFNIEKIEETKDAILQNHLLVQENYSAFVSGDGSCAGCGEKSVLRGAVTMTEAFMRPVFRAKSKRLQDKIKKLRDKGVKNLTQMQNENKECYQNLMIAFFHFIFNQGKESTSATIKSFNTNFVSSSDELIERLINVLEFDEKRHRDIEIIEGEHFGMSVMGMTASTGCNTVYGSTHPSNPHSYPWMNSLFQDGSTIGWLVGESFILDHAKVSVIPERLADSILNLNSAFSIEDYETLAHFDDSMMTDIEIYELPKVWAIGGDGALGDIGFQNLSKVVLQNRPNINVLMLDTQVYSNTGGQNSDSSVMTGGFDMNQYGKHHEGKLTERKEVAQIFTSGHGSPFIACASMANSARFYRAVIDGLTYRGTSFIQSYTTCQPEHGVSDDASQNQAALARDSRGVIEFSFDPRKGELESDAFDLKGNPRINRDWSVKNSADGKEYNLNIVQWAATEGRFKKHFIKLKKEDEKVSLDEIMLRITQNDVVYRKYLDKNHRSYLPTLGIYTDIIMSNGNIKRFGITRQMALFCIERRKNWRKMQSRAGIKNIDYIAQKQMLNDFDNGKISRDDFLNDTSKIFNTYLSALN